MSDLQHIFKHYVLCILVTPAGWDVTVVRPLYLLLFIDTSVHCCSYVVISVCLLIVKFVASCFEAV